MEEIAGDQPRCRGDIVLWVFECSGLALVNSQRCWIGRIWLAAPPVWRFTAGFDTMPSGPAHGCIGFRWSCGKRRRGRWRAASMVLLEAMIVMPPRPWLVVEHAVGHPARSVR